MDTRDPLSGIVVSAAVRLHMELGPGLLESVYEAVLAERLRGEGLRVERQKRIGLVIDGITFGDAYVVDLLVNAELVLELKSVEMVAPVHLKQLLTYIKLLGLRRGLLLNFGAATMREGIRRVVNQY